MGVLLIDYQMVTCFMTSRVAIRAQGPRVSEILGFKYLENRKKYRLPSREPLAGNGPGI